MKKGDRKNFENDYKRIKEESDNFRRLYADEMNQCLNGRGFILKKFSGEIQNRDAFKSDSLLNLLQFLRLKEFKQHLKNVSPLWKYEGNS